MGSRVHVVLVPGFGGFDALGQLEYYANVTPIFDGWRKGTRCSGAQSDNRKRSVIHYFNNYPTAGVKTRADFLKQFLAKRIMRNEIQETDEIALVGHSTGGLDIRQLMQDLHGNGGQIKVDAAEQIPVAVQGREILNKVRRIVFLSVPQQGTNIADWVRSHPWLRGFLVRLLMFMLHHDPIPGWVKRGLARSQRLRVVVPPLLFAAQDVLLEIGFRRSKDPKASAAARAAYAEVSAWFDDIGADFMAINDLTVAPDRSGASLVAEAICTKRPEWADGVEICSYATRGKWASDGRLRTRRPDRLATPWALVKAASGIFGPPGTSLVYRLVHTMCASGPFAKHCRQDAYAQSLDTGELVPIAADDNDGIVNTASMLWPNGKETILIEGDHGDIIGHYRLLQNRESERVIGREFHTYDLLRSASESDEKRFNDDRFTKVWERVFDFCVPEEPRVAPVRGRARPTASHGPT